jgi:hypothetical protein
VGRALVVCDQCAAHDMFMLWILNFEIQYISHTMPVFTVVFYVTRRTKLDSTYICFEENFKSA